MAYYWTPFSTEADGDLRGRPLRYLLVTMLAEAREPVTVQGLIAGCAQEGVIFDGRASKIISDALRWEVRSGRVRRLRRGVYAFGKVPRSTRRWIARRVEQTRVWLQMDPALRRSRSVETGENQGQWDWQDGSWVPGWSFWPAPYASLD